jgi:hypothetical protein
MRDDSSKSKGKPPNCTTFVDQVVPWLLTTLLSSGNTPGIDYGALAKIRICGVGGGHFLREFKDEYRGIEGYLCEVPT